VLAVGDAAFQQKSLNKMGEVASEGRTIILVSHNLVAIEQLCTTALWLEGGKTVELGKASEVVEHYNASFARKVTGTFQSSDLSGDGSVELLSYNVTNAQGTSFPFPITGEDVLIHVELRVLKPISRPGAGLSVWSPAGVMLISLNSTHLGQTFEPWPVGDRTLTVRLSKVPFLPGLHRAGFWVHDPLGDIYAHVEDSITFEIGQSPIYGTSEVTPGFGCVFTQIDMATEPGLSGSPPSDLGELAPSSAGAPRTA
jgi:lipopolysaccharide transport system ATP-binding protein